MDGRLAAPVTRVAAARLSNLEQNVFSSDCVGVEVVNSVQGPSTPRQLCSCLRSTRFGSVKKFSQETTDPSLRAVLEVDAKAKTLLVDSGYTLAECLPALNSTGLTLLGAPESGAITVGGALAVGAHSGGLFQKPLFGYVLEIWIRDAWSQERHLKAGDPFFHAASVSLGLLGIIVKAKFQLVEAANRKMVGSRVSTYGSAGFETANERTHSFQFAPYQQRMVRRDSYSTEESPNCAGCCETLFWKTASLPVFARPLDTALGSCPRLAFLTTQFFACPCTCIYSGTQLFHDWPLQNIYDVEYAVDLHVAGKVFDELSEVVTRNQKQGRYISVLSWCRYLAAVDPRCVLAQSAGGDKATFAFTFSMKQYGLNEFVDELLEVFKRYNGRPHLGKTIRPHDVSYAAHVYGSTGGGQPWLDFEEARQDFDPTGRFMNKSLQRFVAEATEAAKRALAARELS